MSLDSEKRTIKAMILIYCNDKHGFSFLCEECDVLNNYAVKRIDHCPLKDNKPSCKNCKIHCYERTQREKIKKVMKYSGQKMLFRHPYLSILHIF